MVLVLGATVVKCLFAFVLNFVYVWNPFCLARCWLSFKASLHGSGRWLNFEAALHGSERWLNFEAALHGSGRWLTLRLPCMALGVG